MSGWRTIFGQQFLNAITLAVLGGDVLARGRAILRIEFVATVLAASGGRIIAILQYAPAARAHNLRSRLFLWVGVLRKHVARQQGYDLSLRRRHRLHPEVVKNLDQLARQGITRLIVASNLRRHITLQSLESGAQLGLRHRRKRLAHEKGTNRIDVTADSLGT